MSEFLTEEEQIARMKSWWDQYANLVLIAIVGLVVVIGGWQWYSSYRTDQAHAASLLYESYQEADAATRSELAQTLAAEHPGSAYHLFVLFDQVQIDVEAGDLASAQDTLQQAVDVADNALLADLARIRLAKVQQGLDLSDQAINTLNGVGNAGYRSLALEVKGDVHMARGETQLAHESYQAAYDSLDEGDQRPILKMKLDNAAPFDGQYVAIENVLADALREAAESLQNAETPDVPNTEADGTQPLEAETAVEAELEAEVEVEAGVETGIEAEVQADDAAEATSVSAEATDE